MYRPNADAIAKANPFPASNNVTRPVIANDGVSLL
jgi:hypothetical protein